MLTQLLGATLTLPPQHRFYDSAENVELYAMLMKMSSKYSPVS